MKKLSRACDRAVTDAVLCSKRQKEIERTISHTNGGENMNINKLREILVWLFTPVTDEFSYRMHTGFDLLY
jgi:hypothetical protein